MRVSALDNLKAKLIPGRTYSCSDLRAYTTNYDRYLSELLADRSLIKSGPGLYSVPKITAFGEAPPEERELLRKFLKDERFVVYSKNQFNALSLGLTQLHNERVVFNRKRSGRIELGGRVFTFRKWREAPKEITTEFLFVELMNRLNDLGEDKGEVLDRLSKRLSDINLRKFKIALTKYGHESSKKLFERVLCKKMSRA